MALIGRLFVILFGFLAACLVAGMIVVGAVLLPEFSDFGTGPIDPDALNIVLGFGFIFVSGFALLPAMIVAVITEAFSIRGALTYAVGGAIIGLACYLGLVPFDTATLRFEGIVRRRRDRCPTPPRGSADRGSGQGVRRSDGASADGDRAQPRAGTRRHRGGGDRRWRRLLDVCGPQCRRLARATAAAAVTAPAAGAFTAARFTAVVKTFVFPFYRLEREQNRLPRSLFLPGLLG